jgi:hypothetical protein
MNALEKENTFRILKDQPLLATKPIRCFLGWHTWLKWGDPKRGPGSIFVRQSRYCCACNYFDERKFQD